MVQVVKPPLILWLCSWLQGSAEGMLLFSLSPSLSFFQKPQEVWNTSMSACCTWLTSFLAADFVWGFSYNMPICMCFKLALCSWCFCLCVCLSLSFYNSPAAGRLLYTLPTSLKLLRNCFWHKVASVLWIHRTSLHLPLQFITYFTQEEKSGDLNMILHTLLLSSSLFCRFIATLS